MSRINKYIREFKNKIKNKQLKAAVIGLGYVGLPLAVELAKKRFHVTGLDVDKDRVKRINAKVSYITDVPSKEIEEIIDSGCFNASEDFSLLKCCDVIIICVPTPLKRKSHPDISFILSAVRQIRKFLRQNQLIILESTTYPGTTEEVLKPILESGGLKCGKDFYLAFSPERIDPGNKKYPVYKIPKVIGGVTSEATELTAMLYKSFLDTVVPVSSARTAETVKLLENTFRIVNIALIDEMAMMAHKMGLDIWEIIEAAKTKPFGFMPFYPGPGVGGHCLDKNESLYVKEGSNLKTMAMPEFIDYIQSNRNNKVEVLSFDPLKRRSVFKEVISVSARPYYGHMINILTQDGRQIKVTDLHPMFVYDNDKWRLKYAKDIKAGDNLPICLNLPSFNNKQNIIDERIDIINQVKQKRQDLIQKIRVKPLNFSWKDYAPQIKSILRKEYGNKLPDACWEYLSNNLLPLKYFYSLEELVKIEHKRVKLVTGRGPSYSEMPSVIMLDVDFCRMIGYYLSEGCYTKDKSARIRFSFNRSETEYVADVVNILRSLGIRSSIYESKQWHTTCIKVSSNLFGFLIYEVLACGKDCYEMKIPEQVFSLDTERKKALLSGIFRGDACVEHFFGKWHYRKDEKEYFHNVNTANISYFTSSKKLFQQVIILLQDLNIVPTFKKRKYTLSIFGYGQISFLKDFFDGKKKDIIAKYLELNKNRPKNKTFEKFVNFAAVKVKSAISTKENNNWVYSVEVNKPHTFVTSYGIAVHNCIPKDPLYLYWKAKHHGFESRFIKLSSGVINYMPLYVVERLKSILSVNKVNLSGARILISGVSYKKDVLDLRKSPALDIIEELIEKQTKVSYYDPLVPYLKIGRIDLKSVKLSAGELKKYDCVVIAADHSRVDYNFILKNSKLIFDTRNVYKGKENNKIIKL